MKTDALKQALNVNKFDVAFGGARRDEEKSRSKERIISFRSKSHTWDNYAILCCTSMRRSANCTTALPCSCRWKK